MARTCSLRQHMLQVVLMSGYHQIDLAMKLVFTHLCVRSQCGCSLLLGQAVFLKLLFLCHVLIWRIEFDDILVLLLMKNQRQKYVNILNGLVKCCRGILVGHKCCC